MESLGHEWYESNQRHLSEIKKNEVVFRREDNGTKNIAYEKLLVINVSTKLNI